MLFRFKIIAFNKILAIYYKEKMLLRKKQKEKRNQTQGNFSKKEKRERNNRLLGLFLGLK